MKHTTLLFKQLAAGEIIVLFTYRGEFSYFRAPLAGHPKLLEAILRDDQKTVQNLVKGLHDNVEDPLIQAVCWVALVRDENGERLVVPIGVSDMSMFMHMIIAFGELRNQ